MLKHILYFLWFTTLFAFETDYDCVVVGTNPISMFEAIYQKSQGKSVLVIEKAGECGGAWKSITVCGIRHVDLGCHEFGNDSVVAQFLQEYAGCRIVANAPPGAPMNHRGFYPAGGCYELTHHLELIMKKMGVELALNTTLESVWIDSERLIAELKVNDSRITTSKIFVTNCSSIQFENREYKDPAHQAYKHVFPHLYILISDPNPPRFTYLDLPIMGCSRAMNLTQFVGLENTGYQLIAIQVHQLDYLNHAERCLDELKRSRHVDPSATLQQVDQYIYEQIYLNQSLIQRVKPSSLFEILNTSHIANIRHYIPRWKGGLRPWKELGLSDDSTPRVGVGR